MLRGLSVSVEMNGDLILVTGDIMTRSLEATGVHCTSTVTSVSTVSGSVTLQVRVCEVPSYSGPLGTLRSRVGVGTELTYYGMEDIVSLHMKAMPQLYLYLQLTVTVFGVEVMVTSSTAAGETTVP